MSGGCAGKTQRPRIGFNLDFYVSAARHLPGFVQIDGSHGEKTAHRSQGLQGFFPEVQIVQGADITSCGLLKKGGNPNGIRASVSLTGKYPVARQHVLANVKERLAVHSLTSVIFNEHVVRNVAHRCGKPAPAFFAEKLILFPVVAHKGHVHVPETVFFSCKCLKRLGLKPGRAAHVRQSHPVFCLPEHKADTRDNQSLIAAAALLAGFDDFEPGRLRRFLFRFCLSHSFLI